MFVTKLKEKNEYKTEYTAPSSLATSF